MVRIDPRKLSKRLFFEHLKVVSIILAIALVATASIVTVVYTITGKLPELLILLVN